MPITRRTFCQMTMAAGGATLFAPHVALAAPKWVDQRQVGPFILQSGFPLFRHASLLAELPTLEQELQRVLAIRQLTSSIYVYLLASQQHHRQYIAQRYPDVPYRRALFIKQDGRANIFAYQNKELAVDLRHESTHALLHRDLPMVPLWLDEGLAEYYEVEKPNRARHHPHLRALKRDLLFNRVPYISELERRTKLEDMSARDYRHAWAWVHFMLHGPEAAHAELVKFLHCIRMHSAPGSLSDRLARAVPNVRTHFKGHFKHL